VYRRYTQNLYAKRTECIASLCTVEDRAAQDRVLFSSSVQCAKIHLTLFERKKENALVTEGYIGHFFGYTSNKIVTNSGIRVIKDETGRMMYDDIAKPDCLQRRLVSFTQNNNQPVYAGSKAPLHSFNFSMPPFRMQPSCI